MSSYPTNSDCPVCGRAPYKRVWRKVWWDKVEDRICEKCGTRYTPPVSVGWAWGYLGIGLVVTAVGVIWVLAIAPAQEAAGRGGWWLYSRALFLLAGGLLCTGYGISKLMLRKRQTARQHIGPREADKPPAESV
jgi:hypothetical protein